MFYLPKFDIENTVCKAFPHFAQKIRDLVIKREKKNMRAAEELNQFVNEVLEGKTPYEFSPLKARSSWTIPQIITHTKRKAESESVSLQKFRKRASKKKDEVGGKKS
jgi:hypothetical protein